MIPSCAMLNLDLFHQIAPDPTSQSYESPQSYESKIFPEGLQLEPSEAISGQIQHQSCPEESV